ncbi:hypothetical protein C8046_03635 [Serinibacter arcticus]|uniref:PH domain-containing protein n=1 Tax=Serinibacter arcticus TaxID=1655435 RepID=A0A2U1ZSF2_9MICO|nr:hypothetical protein [Serinibacter arcticus]PWD49906.1 hypothetical protein C8046_03635 [Serinibacter arcticus]
MTETVARNRPPPWWMVVLLVLYAAMFTNYATLWIEVPWFVAAPIVAVVLGSLAWFAVASTATSLVVAPEALHVRRRLRPLEIRRDEIVAVHGDIPNRPRWSGRVIVVTTDGSHRIPAFSEPAVGEIIERLQEWSGRGEPEPAPARPSEDGDGDGAG